MHKCKVLYNNLYALQSCVLEFDLKNIFNNTFNRYTFSKRHTSPVVRKEVDRTFIALDPVWTVTEDTIHRDIMLNALKLLAINIYCYTNN